MAAIKAMKTDAHNITGARAGTLSAMSEEMRTLGKTFENTQTAQQPVSQGNTNGMSWEDLKKKKGW
jgi:trans-2-enoyl-CoA reductase